MYIAFVNLLTINAYPTKERTRTKMWNSHNFRHSIQQNNNIQLTRKKYTVFIYSQGSLKIILKDIKYLRKIEKILHHIINNYVSILFTGKSKKYFYKLTQTNMSFHPKVEIPISLSAEKIKTAFPSLEIDINDLKFKFNEADLQYSSEANPSHFVAKVLDSERTEIASLNIYCKNLKMTALIKKSIFLQPIHNSISLFVEKLKAPWNSSAKLIL